MNKPMRRALLYITLMLLAANAGAQSVPNGLSADVSADRQAILIGEPIRLTFTVRSTPGNPIFVQIPDSLPHFEVVNRSKIDTVSDKFMVQLQQIVTVTSFDSGHWVIPAFDLPGTDVVTDSLGVDVGFLPMKPQDQLRDIKDIVQVPGLLPWAWIVASVILLAFLIVVLVQSSRSRKKAAPGEEPLASLTPYEEALRNLDGLALPEASADVKPYYTALDGVLKRYLFREYGWNTSQFTTGDLLGRLSERVTDARERSAIAETLHLEDAVKFAKYFPGNELHKQSREQVRKALDILHKTEKAS